MGAIVLGYLLRGRDDVWAGARNCKNHQPTNYRSKRRGLGCEPPLGTNGRVSAAGWEQVIKDLQHAGIMMSLKGVKKIGYLWWQQKRAGAPVTQISVARKHKSCGVATKLTPAIAKRMMTIQAGHYGRLSYRRLCGKVKLEDLDFNYKRVYNWCRALGVKKYKRYIRPKLMPRHYISRLEWVLDDLVKDENGVPKLLPHDSILGGRA